MRVSKLSAIGIALVFFAASASAQRQMRQGGGRYDPKTEVTFTGVVDQVHTMPGPGAGPGGVHLTIATPTGPATVHVGPAAFVSTQNITFANGDALTIVGSKITMMGQEVVIAREIKKGDQVLTLRDANGFPLWSGRSRR